MKIVTANMPRQITNKARSRVVVTALAVCSQMYW